MSQNRALTDILGSMLKPRHTISAANQQTDTTVSSSTARGATSVPNATKATYSTARTITELIYGKMSLPEYLSAYGPLVQVFGTTVAVFGFYHFFREHRQSRAKVQLAVFHIIRLIESDPDYEALLQDPEELLGRVMDELGNMLDNQLSRSEGLRVLRRLKRKIQEDDLPPAKRQSIDREVTEVEEHRNEADEEEQGEAVDVSMWDVDDANLPPTPNESGFENEEIGLETIAVNRYSPPWLRARARRNQPVTPAAPTGGYGFNYNDFSSSSSSARSPPIVPAPERDAPPSKRPNMVERAMHRAFDPNSPGNQYRPKAIKPKSPSLRTPPKAIAVATNYATTGTDLSPIEESNSVNSTPDETPTQYRVNESRRLHTSLQSARKDRRRSIKGIFKPDEAPVVPVTSGEKSTSPKQQQKEEQEQAGVEWDDVIIDFSPSTQSWGSIEAELAGELATPPSAPSPTQVLGSSWTSSRSRAVSRSTATTRAARTARSPPPSSPCPSPPSAPVARSSPVVRSPPAVSAPPAPTTPMPSRKKRGRGRPPKTPNTVEHTPSRRSTRTTAFKGTFQK